MARENFTVARLAGFECPNGKQQVFLWDAKEAGLALRVTAAGARSFIFQSRLEGKALRITIGEPGSWTIPDAREEARRLQRLLDKGIDPRIERAETIAQQHAQREAEKAARRRLDVSGLDVWAAYIEDRRPHWGDRNYLDHVGMVAEGGQPSRKRATFKETKPGLLRALLNRPLARIDAEAVEDWVARETKIRPTRTALAFRLLRAFLNWCAEHPEYRGIVDADAHRPKRTREKLARKAAKSDALEREMLAAWFAEVRRLPLAMSTFLQLVLLTGCRPGEALDMRWEDVDFQWSRLLLRDKVEGERTIPLTTEVGNLLRELRRANSIRPTLPRRLRDDDAAIAAHDEWQPSPWVFVARVRTGERMTDPSGAHGRALRAAGLPHVTLHGLRRSFGSLSEWCEVPAGIVAQLMGHKPSATAEKHYRVRPLDLLRMWHQRIEDWMLEQGGIERPKTEASSVIALHAIA